MYQSMKCLAFSSVAIVMAGCAATATTEPPVKSTGVDSQQRIEALETQLRMKDQELSKMRSQQAPANDLFPPNPKAGECYARVLLPAKYRTAQEQVVARQESERVEVIPAQYETVDERVLIREASTQVEVIPAQYETVEERVLVRPASTKLIEVPASYKTVQERVLNKPAHTVWKRGPASAFGDRVLSERVSGTGEVMCLVEVPATYKVVTRQEVAVPASTKKVEIPAEYKVVKKRVVKAPARTREVEIPAEYGTVKVTQLVQPAKEKRIKIPAEHTTVTRTEKVSDEQLEWQQVLCEINATPSAITQLQTALRKSGHYDGPIDGVIGPRTMRAVNAYAEERYIPVGDNYVPMAVVKELKLTL